jgi:DNA-binding GntR family transcriptional regulator
VAGEDGLAALEGRPTSVLIADQLRERIIDGSFRPGEQMREAALVEKLQVSRGPVREALQRLSQEGLLVSHRNRGVFVLDLSETDVREIYAAREAIELAAAAAVCKLPPAQRAATVKVLSRILEKMRPLVAAKDWRRVAEFHLSFHVALVTSARNSRLSKIYSTLEAETRICITNLAGSYQRAEDLIQEHQQWVDLLAAGDAAQLGEVIRDDMAIAVRHLTVSMAERKASERG